MAVRSPLSHNSQVGVIHVVLACVQLDRSVMGTAPEIIIILQWKTRWSLGVSFLTTLTWESFLYIVLAHIQLDGSVMGTALDRKFIPVEYGMSIRRPLSHNALVGVILWVMDECWTAQPWGQPLKGNPYHWNIGCPLGDHFLTILE